MNHTINIRNEIDFEFVVCGGGPAGIAAALSAARNGLKTVIIERTGCLGGVAVNAGVNFLLAGRKLHPETNEHVRVIGGIFDEITDRLIAEGKAIEPNDTDFDFNPFGWYPRMASGISFDETSMKILLDKLCEECGVEIFYQTEIVDAIKEGEILKSVIVHNKSGFIKVNGEYFADCTGDADVVYLAGCPHKQGREEDGLMTPASVEMHLDHVDGKELVEYQNKYKSPKFVEIIDRLKDEGIWDISSEIIVCMQLVEPDVFLINTNRLYGVCGTSGKSVSKALMDGRKVNLKLYHMLREYFPGFKNAKIRKICDTVGIRETRRIEGLTEITIENALGGAKYPDTIAATTYNFDLPDPLKVSVDPMMGDVRNPKAEREHVVIRIPYRSLVPKECDNLIVAGRCISCDRHVLGAARIMGPCMQTGQAAGMAAAMAKENGCSFANVDVEQLRQKLWDAGVINPDELPFS